ncbi:MAG: hypothetical protein ACFB9M_07255 [Myxococcota bacterium]
MLRWIVLIVTLSAVACEGMIGETTSKVPDDVAPDSADARPPDSDPEDAQGTGNPSSLCDMGEVLAAPRNGCTDSGCHGAQFVGGLDLLSPNAASRLVGIESTTDACGGTPLVDPDDPQSSLLLLLVDPVRYAAHPDPCSVIMPFQGNGVSETDLQCFEEWVQDMVEDYSPPPPPPLPSAEYEPVPPESYLAKVKGLLVGSAVTDVEVAAVNDDPAAIHTFVSDWVDTPEFETKMLGFFEVALQQRLVGDVEFEDQLDRVRGGNLDEMQRNAQESFGRTALEIVTDDRSFTEILTTQRWMMTTALLSMLLYTDQDASERRQEHVVTRAVPDGAPDPVTLRWMIDNRTWYVPDLRQNCNTQSPFRASHVIEMMTGQIVCRNASNHRQDDIVFRPSDFTDWRPVTIRVGDQDLVPFYDVLRLRSSNEIFVRVPRVGFFTTLAFLSNWQTNADNQFRVTINQALITALGASYTVADQTPQPNTDGLDQDHAEPTTACYGCHRSLDPMRLYFMNEFTEVYQRSTEDDVGLANFAFGGVTEANPGLPGLGQTLADHPQFPVAWTQKLCRYANSMPCEESDPEFQRVVQAFVDSDFDFKTLVRELFASPLVTGASYVSTFEANQPVVSITRTSHLCQILDQRLGTDDACSFAGSSLGLLPDDEFVRGGVDVVQTADTSSFHFAAAEQLCTRISSQLVGSGNRYRPADPEVETIPQIVEELMGLHPTHSRRAVAEARLLQHFSDARDQGASRFDALRSVFVLACQSPEVMALGL